MNEIYRRFKHWSLTNYIEVRYFKSYTLTIRLFKGLKYITLSKYDYSDDMVYIWNM
jgi:hypothetical protein